MRKRYHMRFSNDVKILSDSAPLSTKVGTDSRSSSTLDVLK